MTEEGTTFNEHMKKLFTKVYDLVLPDSFRKVVVENKAATYKRLIDTKKGTKFHESIDLHANLPNYSEVPLDHDLFDLNVLSFDKMQKSFAANIVKYGKPEDEYELKLEEAAALDLSFSPQAAEFQRQVHSCHWFLVPELNSRKFLVNQFRELDLSLCNLVKVDESIRDQQRLEKLNLAGNLLTSLEHLPTSLQALNLSNNQIECVDLKETMVNIKSLDLSFNQIDEGSLAGIHLSFNRLVEVNLGGNNFTSLERFADEVGKHFKGLRSLQISPNQFMVAKNSRFSLIEALPALFQLDGFGVDAERGMWEKIKDFDPANKEKGVITVAAEPPHPALRFACNFDSKDGKVGKSVVEQVNEIKAEEGPRALSLKIKVGTLYELPKFYHFDSLTDEVPSWTYKLEIQVGEQSFSVVKPVEVVDNPADKNNPEKCLKVNFEQQVPLEPGRAAVETLMQGVFVKLFELNNKGAEKFVAFCRLDTFKFVDPLKDLFDLNGKRVKAEDANKNPAVTPADREALGLRGGLENEFQVKLINAEKTKYKNYLVENPIATDWNLKLNVKEMNIDKKAIKILSNPLLKEQFADGVLNIEASLVKNKIE